MNNETITRISDMVAEAINQEEFDGLADDLDELLDGLSAQERRDAVEKAHVTSVMASQPGCLPDAWSAFPMDADPDDIREIIMMNLGEDDFEDETTDWDAVRERVDQMDLSGDSIGAPDGCVIEVFRKSCASVLEDNGIGF